MACALAAVKLHIPIAHVEAGLRSFDRTMPEEINRLITDAMSDFLFTPSPDGDKNLLREGVAKEKIHHVGDIMVDSLLYHLDQAKKTAILDCLNLKDEDGTHGSVKPYALVTLHRPANVDNHRSFSRIIDGLHRISEQLLVVFPMHPRTQKHVHNFGLTDAFKFHTTPDINPGDDLKGQIHAFESFGYLDFLNLMTNATVVLTDSGGIQEETMILNIPCITLRNTTERPITLTEGTNVLVHDNPEKMVAEVEKVLRGEVRQARCPVLWDGRTAERIVQILTR
jgi:UDP-N-acetylglucosamine 2-epimerase (non-hydrolysing)